jgi:DNA replication protein DnaC
VIIIDDIGYVQHSRYEMEVIFTFLTDRYERKPVMISSNLMLYECDKIFKDPMTAMAAIDILVHHSIILEFNGDSVREKQAKEKIKK